MLSDARCRGELEGVALRGTIQLEHLAEPGFEIMSVTSRAGQARGVKSLAARGAGDGRLWITAERRAAIDALGRLLEPSARHGIAVEPLVLALSHARDARLTADRTRMWRIDLQRRGSGFWLWMHEAARAHFECEGLLLEPADTPSR